MKVLLVNGSPHRNGCTAAALAEVASALRDEAVASDFFWIGTEPLGGCVACFQCRRKGKCVLDDKVNEFVELAAGFDGFVFGSPVYYAGMNGSMTSFMDRVMPLVPSCYWNMVHGNTPEEVRLDAEGLQIMRALGRNMAWLLKLIEAGRMAGIPLPRREEIRLTTNFIR